MQNEPELKVGLTWDQDYTTVFPSNITASNIVASSLNGAVKYDQGKLDWSLLPIESVEEILKVLEFGKQKYAAWNWASGGGFKYSRLFGSLLRHIFAWWRGEDKDPETGLSHLAHAGCNILFLLYYIKHKDTKYPHNDDRPV